jgi:hypothetical protein
MLGQLKAYMEVWVSAFMVSLKSLVLPLVCIAMSLGHPVCQKIFASCNRFE